MGDTRFVCPRCGGDCFGTTNPTAHVDQMIRRCHGDGDGNEGCGFKWPVRDDWKYFVGIVVEEETRPFTSQEDFHAFRGYGG